MIEENRVLKAQLGGRQLRLTDTERRRLAALAHPLGRKRLKNVATLVTSDTLMRWYKRLIAQKFDGSTQRRQLGRPRVAEEVEQLVIRMAEEHATWGYRRIQGALTNLGHHIDAITVHNILRRHHMEPVPQRRKAGMRWAQFLKMHWEVLTATDFFTVEVATWHGLVTYYVLVVMELATRRGQVAGITPHPTAAFMQQCARQRTDPFEGFLLGKRYLIHDRDTNPLSCRAQSSRPRQPTDRAGGRSGWPNGSRGAAEAPRWTAQLLLSRGGLTRRSISTIRGTR